MIRHLLRPIHGLSLLICLILAGCSGQPEKPVTSSVPGPAQTEKARQRLQALNQRVLRIDDRINDLREEQLNRLEALTSETESLKAEIQALNLELGVKPPAVVPRPAAPVGKTVGRPSPHALPAAGAPAETAPKGPLGPLSRLLLIVIALFAIWIMARIFLGRLGDEEDDDEEIGGDAADEDLNADEGPFRLDPEVRAPGEKSDESPRGETNDDLDEPRR